jgi:hypothetical protein
MPLHKVTLTEKVDNDLSILVTDEVNVCVVWRQLGDREHFAYLTRDPEAAVSYARRLAADERKDRIRDRKTPH